MYNNFNPYSMYPYQMQNNGYNTNIQRVEVIKVNGENGANAYQLAPNSSVLLLDESQPIVWLKTTDGGGYPTITPYTITPYQKEPPIDMKSLNERLTKLEGIINESYFTKHDVKQNESSNETNVSNGQKGTKSSRNAK